MTDEKEEPKGDATDAYASLSDPELFRTAMEATGLSRGAFAKLIGRDRRSVFEWQKEGSRLPRAVREKCIEILNGEDP